MNEVFAKYATRAVPRYTSYPTVPHFCSSFPEATYREWLGDLDPDSAISLYLHVPFCRKMCWYCGCNMKLASRYEPVADYVDTLITEIELIAAATPRGLRVSHLHWGGGTPTILSERDLTRVMDHVRQHFTFEEDAELAIESDPRTLSDAMIEEIGRQGFNRGSFGVQEFDPSVQQAINRVQPPELVADCVEKLRAAGITGINFDLIYGLPHQSIESLEKTVELVADMAPDRLALFGYAHVPWMAKNQKMIQAEALPRMAERAQQATAASNALLDVGYNAIGLDHFARPEDPLSMAAASGKLRRNFQGYTIDAAQTLIGLGATSIGRTPFGFVQNIAETGAWARAVDSGRLPVAKGLVINDDDRLRGQIIERLMCDGEVDTHAEARAMGSHEHWCAAELEDLEHMVEDGLLERHEGQIRLTDAGRPLARVVASVFDSYLRHNKARHSVAV